MTVSRAGGMPGALEFRYDVSACNAADHLLITGNLGDFQTAASVDCSIGRGGTYTGPMPPGNRWFVIAGVESAWYSSLGMATAGERFVSGVTEACPAIPAQNTTAICP